MAITVKHAKTNTIADWTQADINTMIGNGLLPAGTTLDNISLASDWNSDHFISTAGASDGDVLTVVDGEAEWAAGGGGGGSPAGSTGAIQFNNAGAFGADTSNLFWDDTNNRLGVGTATPTSALHISGTNDTSQQIKIDGTGNTSSVKLNYNGSEVAFFQNYQNTEVNLGTALAAPILFYTSNTERIRLTSNGNLGVGTASPSYLFDAKKSGGIGTIIGSFGDTSNNSRISFKPFDTSIEGFVQGSFGTTFKFNSGGFSVIDSGNTGDILFLYDNVGLHVKTITSASVAGATFNQLKFTSNWFPSNDTVNPAINLTTYNSAGSSDQLAKIQVYNGDAGRILLNPTGGNVGIGTTTPSGKLTVIESSAALTFSSTDGLGNTNTPTLRLARTSSSGYTKFELGDSAGGQSAGIWLNGAGEIRYVAGAGGYFPTFYSNNAEAMRISTAGNVGIGTISPSTAKLTSIGNATYVAGLFSNVFNQNTLSVNGSGAGSTIDVTSTGYGRSIVITKSTGSATFNSNNAAALDISGIFQHTGSSGVGRGINVVVSNNTVSSGILYGANISATANTSGATAVGLSVTSASSGGTSYSALFNGGNVGIGTTNPGAKLHIDSGVVGGTKLRFSYAGGGAYQHDIVNNFSGDPVEQYMRFVFVQNSSTFTPLTLRGDGNVGIGTTSPTSKLHVVSTAVGGQFVTNNPAFDPVTVQCTDATGYSSVSFYDNASALQGGFGYANASAFAGLASKVFFYSNVKPMVFSTDNGTTNAITISTAGNVGIKTGSPTARLHLPAGTATANTAPLKLSAGTNLTTVEDGAFEFDGTNLYFTVGGVRKTVVLV